MSYFLTTESLALNAPTTLEGDEAKHLLLSRRIKVGEEIEMQDSQNKRFLCIVEKINKKSLAFTPIKKLNTPAEYSTNIILCQALIAEQALDIIIQKSTELGVHEIVIFTADHSPRAARPEKMRRWEKIAKEAAKQCGRAKATQIAFGSLTDILTPTIPSKIFYLSQHAARTLADSRTPFSAEKNITILVGPEGGWSDAEQKILATSEATGLLLSPFTLRAETAAIAAISQISLFLS